MLSKKTSRVLVCPFGDLNLLVHLFQLLEKKLPGKYAPTFLSFTKYDEAIYRNFDARHVHIAPGECHEWFAKGDLDDVCRFTHGLSHYHGGLASNDYYGRIANHYGAEIHKLLQSSTFDSAVYFNGRLNLFIACLDMVAKQNGIPRLVFEQGLFRPDWITIDGNGVNHRNSIQSCSQLFSDEAFCYQQRDLFQDIRSVLPIDRDSIPNIKRRASLPSLLRAYASSKLQPRRNIFLRNAENRDLLESALLSGKRKPPKPPVSGDLNASEAHDVRYLFCPFQVETDTQIVLHSPWISRMRELVDVLCSVVDRLNESGIKAHVIFKGHPLSPVETTVSHPFVSVADHLSVPEIFELYKPVVVTINSTVGIEALDAGIPVVTLGDAFFNLPGVVLGNCRDEESLTDLLSRFWSNSIGHDVDMAKRFTLALREKYQVRAYNREPTLRQDVSR